jgi:hypothetical protein
LFRSAQPSDALTALARAPGRLGLLVSLLSARGYPGASASPTCLVSQCRTRRRSGRLTKWRKCCRRCRRA